jgi:protoporphyrinogen oxidase
VSVNDDPPRTAIIIGAGPAGLTAALELLTRTNIRPIVLEKSSYMGGISRTVNYKGNRIDIGGHRFFSKSDRVMNWWLGHLPLEENGEGELQIAYQGKTRQVGAAAAIGSCSRDSGLENRDGVMLVRSRKSRIYFLRKFFDYPIQLTSDTLRKLGFVRSLRIGFSYLRRAAVPTMKPASLEQFFINRFGRELYLTFFKSYTEKVWGVPCANIGAEWGEQRIKGLSIRKAIAHNLNQAFNRNGTGGLSQKSTETSLIERFLYPKYGPGQMWEEVARKVVARGGVIVPNFSADQISVRENRIVSVAGTSEGGSRRTYAGDLFFSTMPIKDLIQAFDAPVPDHVRVVSDGLVYRDFITVGLLANKLKVTDDDNRPQKLIADNWIYIQEPDVLAGRLQIFNNWSPHMVADESKVWLGVEYFCYENDELWNKPDAEMTRLAVEEIDRIGILDAGDVLDSIVIRMPKTYPAYFGTYSRFGELREYLDGFSNLFLLGRNGMHRYNNQDHSMLTAMAAVDNIIAGRSDKSNLWAVNTEQDYHESK